MAEKETSRRPTLKIALVLLALIALLAVGRFLNVQIYLQQALQWVDSLGIWGPVAFAVIYIVAAVFLLPGLILTMGAGVIWGVGKGFVVVIVSATLAATAAFLIGRYLARDWVARKIEGNENFKAIDKAVADEGWKIVGLTRLSPVFPYNLLNYAYGLTQVSLRDFFLASFIGMMPGTVMYVYLGSLAGSLTQLNTQQRETTTLEWVVYGVGLAVTLAVTIYVTRVARRALQKRIGN